MSRPVWLLESNQPYDNRLRQMIFSVFFGAVRKQVRSHDAFLSAVLAVAFSVGGISKVSAQDAPIDQSATSDQATGAAAAPPKSPIIYNRDVRPILADNCFACHGPDSASRQGDLRLDLREEAVASSAIVAGDPDASEVIRRIGLPEDDELAMPPTAGHKRLTDAQKQTLIQWIAEGAVYQPHWAFIAPSRPELPTVSDQGWVRNPIDQFILAQLEKSGLKPAAEADRRTLARRVSLDLIGLPPTVEQVEAFAADTAPDAYERFVESLLESKRYGEHRGRYWLDYARFGDTHGIHFDNYREMWSYRDWVIDAFNRNLPFDQFTIEQLAGDLLPGAGHEQKVATGFHRQTLLNKEGGVDQEEYRNKAVVDRVDTTGAVWLGLTVGCAECHTHKFDPITQREFFQLFAFFNNADDKDIPAPTEQELAIYHAAKTQWDNTRAPLQQRYDDYVRDELPALQTAWEATSTVDLPVWHALPPVSAAAAQGTTLTTLPDHSVLASGTSPLTETYTVAARWSASMSANAAPLSGFRLEVLPDASSNAGPGRSGNGNFVLTNFALHLQGSDGASSRTVKFSQAAADFSQKDWAVAGAIDADPKTGWAISPQNKRRHVAVFECAEPLVLKPSETLVFTLDHQFGNQHTLLRFRLSATSAVLPLAPSLIDDGVAIAWNTPPAQRTSAHQTALAEYFRDVVDPGARKLRQPLDALAKTEPKYPDTKAAILTERSTPRDTHVHIRGDFLRPGPRVEPATPKVLHPFAARAATPDRLDLARWLVDERNPLTSRVTVNHMWKHLFGRGLVVSVNDFGTQGEKPSHPELLDWLATEFPRLGWSRKALLKLIVMSATYQQSSDYRSDLVEVDPLNTLLARQSRLRLEAEIIRDAHLTASGLLARKVGGPSVRPQLPADIAALGYANSVKWRESEGEDRFRRGMYIFFQRTVPYPMLMTFDAPNSTATCTRRERSNTPLQALTLWNDPVFFDAARALAQRLMVEPTPDAQLERAFEICLARTPTEAELARLRQLYDDQKRLTLEHPASATAILGLEGDTALPADPIAQASLVATVRTIMNLDEFITRD